MSPRADEHEGDLNDTETKRRHDRAEARAVQILQHDALELTESGTFLRWFSKYAYPMLVQNFPVNNGSMHQHRVGVLAKRSEEHTSELQSRQYLVCSLLL